MKISHIKSDPTIRQFRNVFVIATYCIRQRFIMMRVCLFAYAFVPLRSHQLMKIQAPNIHFTTQSIRTVCHLNSTILKLINANVENNTKQFSSKMKCNFGLFIFARSKNSFTQNCSDFQIVWIYRKSFWWAKPPYSFWLVYLLSTSPIFSTFRWFLMMIDDVQHISILFY